MIASRQIVDDAPQLMSVVDSELRSRSPMIYIHPAKERNGNRVFVEGRYKAGDDVLLIDDLVTSGGGILETATFLRANAGLNV